MYNLIHFFVLRTVFKRQFKINVVHAIYGNILKGGWQCSFRVTQLFPHLLRCQPPNMYNQWLLILYRDAHNKQLSFVPIIKVPNKSFVNLIHIYPFWRLKDHWLCQPPALSATIIAQNLGMNTFSSSQPLYKLPMPICEEIIQLNKTNIFGSQPPCQHILWMKWWLTLRNSHLWGLFLTSIFF